MHNCSNPNYIHVTHAHSLPSNDVASNTMYYQRQYRTTLVALTKTYYVTMYTTNEHDVLLEHTHEPPRAITILHCSSNLPFNLQITHMHSLSRCGLKAKNI